MPKRDGGGGALDGRKIIRKGEGRKEEWGKEIKGRGGEGVDYPAVIGGKKGLR